MPPYDAPISRHTAPRAAASTTLLRDPLKPETLPGETPVPGPRDAAGGRRDGGRPSDGLPLGDLALEDLRHHDGE